MRYCVYQISWSATHYKTISSCNILVSLVHQKFHLNLEKVFTSVVKVETGKEVEVSILMQRLTDIAPDLQNL